MSIPFHYFLNFRSARVPTLSPDGQKMAFLTDITGTNQLWTMGEALGWPDQLTFYDDRLLFARYSPTEPRIAFGKDAGGDEKQKIFLVTDEGGVPRRLSRADAKHHWGGWSPDGSRIAWSHNDRNGRDFDVFVYDVESGRERCVFEGAGYHYVACWMPGGDSLVVGCAHSNIDNDLWLLEIESGDRTLLTDHDPPARFSSPCPTPDAQRLYLLTNQDSDFTQVAKLDLSGPNLEMVTDSKWDAEGLALSDDGRWLVVQINEEGYTEIEIRDLQTGETHAPEGLPTGIFGPPRFAPESHRFALTSIPSADTTDAWTVDAETGATSRWTRSAMPGVTDRDVLIKPELVHFSSFDDLEIPAFFFAPRDAEPPYPVVIDIHGGPESQRRPQLSAFFQYLLQEGFAVLAPNVRGSRGYGSEYMSLDDVRKRMDSVADIRAAHQWLTSTGRADPDRIAVMGGSYGGFMVLSAMVTYPDLWAAGVDIVGIANFVSFLENTSDYRRHLRESEYGSLEHDREFLEEISPLNHVDQIDAPLLVIHGENDPRVPSSEARQIVDALDERGLPVESIIYPDEGHGLAKRDNRLDAYPRIADFLRRYVRSG